MRLFAKNFTECSEEELRMILGWRNSDIVSENSLSNSEISWEQHCEFINVLKTACDKAYFLILDEAAYIGVVSLRNIDGRSAEVGYYKNPAAIRKGIGVLLLDIAADTAKNRYGLTEVVTQVIAGNAASEKSMVRAGFCSLECVRHYTSQDGREVPLRLYKKVLTNKICKRLPNVPE